MSAGNLKFSKQSPVNYNLPKQQYIPTNQSQDTEIICEKVYLYHPRHGRKFAQFYKKENFLLTCKANWIIKREKPFKRPGMTGELIYRTLEQSDLQEY